MHANLMTLIPSNSSFSQPQVPTTILDPTCSQKVNKYKCIIDQELIGGAAYACSRCFVFTDYMAAQHFPSWPPSWKYAIISSLWLHQSMCIYLRNNPAKFIRIWLEMTGPYAFLKRSPQQEEWRYEISSWSKNKCSLLPSLLLSVSVYPAYISGVNRCPNPKSEMGR